MSLVKVSSQEASSISLCCCIASLASCTLVALSIVKDRKNARSYHLQLVLRLLLSDVGLSVAIIFYYVIQYPLNNKQLEMFCNFFLPCVLYFLLCQYGWTVFLAFKFRTALNNVNAAPEMAITPPLPLWSIWVMAGVLVLPILVLGLIYQQITHVDTNSADTNQSCTFNADSHFANTVNLITFQLPLLFTILANLFFYSKGIYTLRTSPHSVVARQMRRAGGYIAVLLLVWVPNFLYNFAVIFDPGHRDLTNLLDIAVILASAQGMMNAFVYVWCNRSMRLWLRKHMYTFGRGGRLDSSATETTKDEDDNEDEDIVWLQESLSFSGRGSEGSYVAPSLPELEDCHVTEAGAESTATVIASAGGNKERSKEDTENPIQLTKSILIMKEARVKSGKGKNKDKDKRNTQFIGNMDLDHERYVRFGENQTRTISVASSVAKTSSLTEFSNDLRPYDGHDNV